MAKYLFAKREVALKQDSIFPSRHLSAVQNCFLSMLFEKKGSGFHMKVSVLLIKTGRDAGSV